MHLLSDGMVRGMQSKPRATGVEDLGAAEGDPDFMVSLARGLAVIRAFDEAHQRLSVAETSARSGIPRSAARRCLYTLQRLGYVGAEGSVFFLKPAIVSLGHVYLASTALAASAQPVLDRITRETGEPCSISVLEDTEVLYIANSLKPPLISVHVSVGRRLPAYCTASGRVMLAALPESELDRRVDQIKIMRLTEKTVQTKRLLAERIRQAREDGFAIVDQEYDLGVRSIGVPVVRRGQIAASLSISVLAERCSRDELESRLLPALRRGAAEFA
jgi:IclR family pca regulon transcriptional regulator